MATTKNPVLKCIMLGDSGVGKTSLLRRYVDKRFGSYKTTIGADFYSKELMIGNQAVRLQIWDTAGQERFQSLGTYYYRGADVCILVFDINNMKTFPSIDKWRTDCLTQIEERTSNFSYPFPFVVFGSKTDLTTLGIKNAQMIKEWCRNNGDIPCFFTSAKEDVNVTEGFLKATENALARNVATRVDENVELESQEETGNWCYC